MFGPEQWKFENIKNMIEIKDLLVIRFKYNRSNFCEGAKSSHIENFVSMEYKINDIIKSKDVIGDIKSFVKENFIDKLEPGDSYEYTVCPYGCPTPIFTSEQEKLCDYLVEKYNL